MRRLYLLVAGVVLSALVFTAVGFSSIEADLPRVDRRSLRIDTVERGELERSVSGPGALVPEHIRWLTAEVSARVERIEVEPGTEVEPTSVVLVLRNSDLELAALEAKSELAAAQAELANLRANLETSRLTQQATVATVRADHSEASRTASANEKLAENRAVSGEELAGARERAEELETRLAIETRRLAVLGQSRKAQVAAQEARVEQLRAVVEFRQKQLERLSVTAGERGVLQAMEVEVGQWVTPGTVLAKVIEPEELEAELWIPEVRAKDLRIGQSAKIDTHNGMIDGRVSRIDPAVTNGTVTVDVVLDGALPPGARPDLSVDGTIELEHLSDVSWIRRPAYAEPNSTISLFVLDSNGVARQVSVRLGRASLDAIEVVEGLEVGDEVVVSDTAAWREHERIAIE